MPIIIELNCETNEQVEREATAEEAARLDKLQADFDAEKEAKEATAAKREAALSKLAALGLTADDLKALGL